MDGPASYLLTMSRVEQIKTTIEQLSLEERAELTALLAGEYPDDDWDRLMKQHAAQGKFATMNEKADTDLRKGRCIDLDSCDSR